MDIDTQLIWIRRKCIVRYTPTSLTMLFSYERRGRTTSISSVSVFGDDHHRHRPDPAAFDPSRFRPVSISIHSDCSARDGDIMVSMIGGGNNARVRRESVGSALVLTASPYCFQAEERAKQPAYSPSMDTSELESVEASASTSFLRA
jgi:hypothetical protein